MTRMNNPILLGLVALALAACQPAPAPVDPPAPTEETRIDAPAAGDPAAAEAVMRYLTAKIGGDRDGVRELLCSDMEADLDREALSFSGVEARLEGMVCTTDPTNTSVTCQGEIIATYDGENRPIALSAYRVVNEDGVWRWCGEAE